MNEEAIRKQKEAFEKMKVVLEYAKSLIKLNVKILDIAENVEKKIFEVGAKPAFPINIGINEIAAHYTPSIDDQTILKEGDMVKVDIGLHVDGYISDNAFTILVGKNSHPMIETARKAVEEARKILMENIKIREISEVILLYADLLKKL
jgi:methionyl aminopeptidase